MTTLHCDNCNKPLGTYLYGPGGIEEKASITGGSGISLPDITCNECMKGISEDTEEGEKKV